MPLGSILSINCLKKKKGKTLTTINNYNDQRQIPGQSLPSRKEEGKWGVKEVEVGSGGNPLF